MKPLMSAVWCLLALSPVAWCGAQDAPAAIVERAIKAIDPEGKMAAAKGLTWRTDGKLLARSELNGKTTLSESRNELEIHMEDINHLEIDDLIHFGIILSDVVFISGDQAWHMGTDDPGYSAISANNPWRRQAYVEMIPVNPAFLKDKAFKLELVGREEIAGKPADTLKITGPEGLSFTLSFDVAGGLPVRRQVVFSKDENGKDIPVVSTFDYRPEQAGYKTPRVVVSKAGDSPEFTRIGLLTLETTPHPTNFVPKSVLDAKK